MPLLPRRQTSQAQAQQPHTGHRRPSRHPISRRRRSSLPHNHIRPSRCRQEWTLRRLRRLLHFRTSVRVPCLDTPITPALLPARRRLVIRPRMYGPFQDSSRCLTRRTSLRHPRIPMERSRKPRKPRFHIPLHRPRLHPPLYTFPRPLRTRLPPKRLSLSSSIKRPRAGRKRLGSITSTSLLFWARVTLER